MNILDHKLSKLLTLIRDLSIRFPTKGDLDIAAAVAEVRELTKTVWEAQHANLLLELEILTCNTDHDMQQFWFECLAYPYSYPLKKNIEGQVVSHDYGNLPAKFNEIEFHDARILEITVSQNVEMIIDHIETWHEESRGWEQIGKQKKLLFTNATVLVNKEPKHEARGLADFINCEILNFQEVPALQYFQRIEGVTCTYDQRIFKGLLTAKGFSELIIIAESWQLDSISPDDHIIGYAFKPTPTKS